MPRPRLTLAIAAVALLAACPARVDVVTPARKTPKPATTPRVAATGSPAAPASRPPTSPGPEATATPAPVPARLRKPETPTLVLRGTVKIDASYAVGAAGSVISNNGSSVLALADIGLLANNGGNLISDRGGSLISDNGGALISDGGGGLIANNGGGLVSKTKYALFQATPAPALGQVLPAAGILLRATSLRGATPISLGVDGRGEPVFAIRSDAAGAYEVYVPADLAGNLLITAEVPKSVDPRLRYEMLVPAEKEAAPAIDEDSVLVTRLLRRAYVNVLTDIFAAPDVDAMVAVVDTFTNLQPEVRAVFTSVARDFRKAADETGVTGSPRAELAELAERVADVFTARVDFDAATVGEGSMPVRADDRADAQKLLGTPLIPLANRLMRAIREKATERLTVDPGLVGRQVWFVEANAARAAAGLPAFEIKRPSDVGLVIVDAYLTSTNVGAFDQAGSALSTIGMNVEPTSGVTARLTLLTIANTATLTIGGVIVTDPAAKAEAIATIKGWKAR